MCMLAVRTVQPLPAATCYRALLISTATASRITSFTALAHVKRQSGILVTTFSSAAPLGRLFRLAGPWSHPEQPAFSTLVAALGQISSVFARLRPKDFLNLWPIRTFE